MKQLWQYIKNPQENCSYDFSIRAMAFSALLCLLVSLLFKFLTTAMFVMAGIEIPALTSDRSVLPLWFLILIPPVIEELGFRLPLRRSRLTIFISVAIVVFVFTKAVFTGGLYSEHLLYRICIALFTSVVINLFIGKWLLNVQFRYFFYLMAVLFAMLHIANYAHQTLAVSQWLYVICYAVVKIPGSILYGYARMRHGVLFCIIIHIITKSISSLYLIWGERYNLCKAVPPLKANCSLRKSSLNISTNARLIIKSCSTIAKSVHGTNSFHAIMEALSIIIHQFQCQYSCLLSIGYSLYHPMPDVRNS